MQCQEVVMHDHAVLRRALNILDVIVKALERGKPIEIADAETIVNFIKVFGIEYHQTMEQEVLFPILRRAVPLDSRIQQIVFQHEEQRALVLDIDEALRAGRGADFVLQSHRLIALCKANFEQEEMMLAEVAKADMVVAELAENRQMSEEYTDYTRLGWKYLNDSESRTKTA